MFLTIEILPVTLFTINFLSLIYEYNLTKTVLFSRHKCSLPYTNPLIPFPLSLFSLSILTLSNEFSFSPNQCTVGSLLFEVIVTVTDSDKRTLNLMIVLQKNHENNYYKNKLIIHTAVIDL